MRIMARTASSIESCNCWKPRNSAGRHIILTMTAPLGCWAFAPPELGLDLGAGNLQDDTRDRFDWGRLDRVYLREAVYP